MTLQVIDVDDQYMFKWIAAKDQLPPHMRTVVIYVIGGYLMNEGDDGYVDCGVYNQEDSRWQASSDMLRDDAIVEVSHWMHVTPPEGLIDV